jgi:uncharacterized RDD family membrane protein YckC
MNTENYNEVQQDLFVPEDLLMLERAGNGRRFVNLLIDSIIARYVINLATGYVLGLLFYKLAPDNNFSLYGEQDSLAFIVFIYLSAFVNALIYYTFCEKVFNGQTLGKLITGTKAVREDGSPLTWKNALLRSLVRYVPFDAFSIWSDGGIWHDRWTKTIVVRKR